MTRRGIQSSEGAGRLRCNQFHRCDHGSQDVVQAGRELAALLAASGEDGLREKVLLDWFGASTARIALLAHAFGRPPPAYVARELIVGSMRADFATLEVPLSTDIAPQLLLVEFQGALPGTLFEAGNRGLKYWGRDFLDGFSQLMDWHFVGCNETLQEKVETLTAECRRPLETIFMLAAGLRRFAREGTSQRRLTWWSNATTLGSNFKILCFEDIANEALHLLESYGAWGVDPTARMGRSRHARKQGRSPAFAPARNDEAARTGRLHGRTGAGAGR